jgi:hypothetical protein
MELLRLAVMALYNPLSCITALSRVGCCCSCCLAAVAAVGLLGVSPRRMGTSDMLLAAYW